MNDSITPKMRNLFNEENIKISSFEDKNEKIAKLNVLVVNDEVLQLMIL